MAKDKTENNVVPETAEGQIGEKEEIKNIVTIEQAGPCKKKIIVEVPEEKIKSALDEQYSELRRDAVVPGFRKGRAPLRLIEKRFGSNVSEQVKLKLLAEASETAIKDNEISSLDEPDIDYENIKLPESGPMKFDFEVEVRPEFELPKLEGIKIEKSAIDTSDQRVEEEITAMRKRAGLWAPKEQGGAETDEQVIADVVLAVEGEAEHEKLDNIEIQVKYKGFAGPIHIEGLDTLLKGAKHGDQRKTSVELPSSYFHEKYRGKKVDVEITVKEVKQLEPAELNAEFLGRFGLGSEEEFRKAITESLKQQTQQQSRSAMAEQVHKYLLENTTFDLPANIVADQSKSILQRQYSNLLMRGVPQEKLNEQMEALKTSSDAQAAEQLKLLFIMQKIADKFDISVSEEEINGYIAQVAASKGRRPEKMREELARDGSLAQFSLQIREHKCIEKILEKAEITETAPKKAAKAAKKAAETKTKETAEAGKDAEETKAKKITETGKEVPAKKEAAKPKKTTKAAAAKTTKKPATKAESQKPKTRENAAKERTKKTTKKSSDK